MKDTVINIQDKLGKIEGLWQPKIIEQFNDYHIKVAKIQGEFIWHDHKETDEVFMVIEGEMKIMLKDEAVALKTGDFYVVPKGIMHKPVAEKECHILLIEPTGTVNTGDVTSELTASNSDWI